MVTMTQRSQAEGMLKNRYGSEDARLNARSILALADSVDALRASLARDRSVLHACPDCGSPTALDKCGACTVGRRSA